MSKLKYKRVLLKLSGEKLMGENGIIDPVQLLNYANIIKGLQQAGCEVVVVIGGGNIFRGKIAEAAGVDEIIGHYAGMVATKVNGLVLAGVLQKQGVGVSVLDAHAASPGVKFYETFYAKKLLTKVKSVF